MVGLILDTGGPRVMVQEGEPSRAETQEAGRARAGDQVHVSREHSMRPGQWRQPGAGDSGDATSLLGPHR